MPAILTMIAVSMKSVLLVCVALSAATAERVDLNSEVDKYLIFYNQLAIQGDAITVPIPSATWEDGSHTGGTIGAIDSFARTGDCFQDQTAPDTTTYEMHFGLRLFAVFLPKLTVNGETMTALQKVGKNSMKLLANLRRSGDECTVEIEELAIEQIDQVTNYASAKAYDELVLSSEHLTAIQAKVNQQIDAIRPQLSHYITKFVCNYGSKTDQTEALFQSFSVMLQNNIM